MKSRRDKHAFGQKGSGFESNHVAIHLVMTQTRASALSRWYASRVSVFTRSMRAICARECAFDWCARLEHLRRVLRTGSCANADND